MKHFLIYIDSLGYEKRAEGEAKTTGRPVEDIRESYINSIEKRLKYIEKKETIKSFKKSEYGDDFVVFTDSIWNAFITIGEVLKANLPLAIGIGFLKVDDSYLIERSTETISNLKTNIIPKYKKFYESEHGEHSLRQTFILFTPEAYEQLDSKRKCSKPYPSAEFNFIEQKEFERELKVLEFLEKIGSQRAEYREIEELYVAPQNYEKIKRTLDQHNIVFIVGDAEMGKTYTSIRLLWEYFKDGYEPVYLPEERRREQWEFIRHKSKVEGKVIYFEDPFGKVEFERAEGLFRDIGTFVDEIKSKKCKIILTSREKVFKEFDKRKETAEDLLKYVTQLKVNLAYSKEKLAEILENYIIVFQPKWIKDNELRKIAFKAVGEKLRTPMSIKKLIDSSKDVKDKEGLKTDIEKAAEDTKTAFAREIKEIFNQEEYDRLVFLCFPYIGITYELAKPCYEEVLNEIGYSTIKARAFDDLIGEFYEVEVSYSLRYVHPSYEDAFGLALTDAGKPNNICTKIFSRVLIKLSEKNEVARNVARVIANNFDKIPEDIRNELLIKLSDNDETVWSIVWTIAENFDKLPEDIRNLLFKFSEMSKPARVVARVIANNFDILPEDLRDELLLKLSEKDEVAWIVAEAVANNFNNLSKDVRNELLLKLSEKHEAAWNVAKVITNNFDKLPENIRNLLFKLSEKEKTALVVARAVTESFDELPENVRNILFKLSENDKTARVVSRVVAENFNELPDDVRNKLLLKLSEKDKAALDVVRIVANNFNELPDEIRSELLLKLSEKGEVALDVVRIVENNFDKLPEGIRIRNLLFRLSDKNTVDMAIAGFVTDSFDKLPDDIRNGLLLKLSDKDDVAFDFVRIIADLFDKLPGDIRNEILLKLSEKDGVAFDVARIVECNFDKLPEGVRSELLLKLSEKKKAIRIVARVLAENFDKFPENIRNKLLQKKGMMRYEYFSR